jgi:hypothetical protein
MSQIKGKQIKDNTLDLNKVKGGSKILPADASLGTLKTTFTNNEFVTKFYVDNISVDATTLDGDGLIANNGKLDVNKGDGIDVIADKVVVKAANTTLTVAAGGVSVNLTTLAAGNNGLGVSGTALLVNTGTGIRLDGDNVAVDYNTITTRLATGSGISKTGTTEADFAIAVDYPTVATTLKGVTATTGLTNSGNTLAVDYATVATTLKGVTATTGLTNSGNTLLVDYTTVASGLKSNGLVASAGKLSVGAGAGITVNTNDVAVNYSAVATQLAGNGLVPNSTTIDVNAGNGIQVLSDAVALNIANYSVASTIGLTTTGSNNLSFTSGAALNATAATNINLTPGGSNNVLITRDARYVADYSSSYTDRSLVDKQYVDSLASGLDPKASVKHATNKVLTGLTYTTTSQGTFTKGSAITMADIDTAGGTLVIGDRILVKDQVDQKQNGIYTLATSTTLVRASDMDGNPTTEVSAGNFTFVETGSFANMGFVLQGSGVLTLNTSNLVWVQFSGAGQVTAGSGLTKSGNELRFLPNENTAGAGLVHGDAGGHGFISVGAGAGISVTADAVAVALDSNSGLQATNGLKVVAGAGILVGTNVSINLATTNSGLQTTSGLAILLRSNSGLAIDATGMTISGSNTISVGTSVSVRRNATNSGLVDDTNGLAVGGSNTITVSGTSVSVRRNATNSGLVDDANGLAIGAGNGLQLSGTTASVRLRTTSGLAVDGTGLTVGQGRGIEVSTSSVAVIKPTATQQSVTPLAVAANATATTGITLGSTPAGVLRIAINGMISKLGDGVKTDSFFFSSDNGVTAKSFANIASGDVLYFNASAAGFDLETDDLISIVTIA